jgi:predicted nucleotidyltransferase/plasmid maintenance system antidote protein VapI
MESFGEIIRKSRLKQKLPLRTVAAYLDIDQAILSKIERGLRRASKDIVVRLAEYYKTDEDRLLVAWLSDQLVYQLEGEENAMKALQVAEDKVLYGRKEKVDHSTIIEMLRDFFKKDGRIAKAWVFGSFARGEDRPDSDIDLIVSYSEKASGTLLDYADIKLGLENLLHRTVDVVEDGFIKAFARESVNRDKIQIYG